MNWGKGIAIALILFIGFITYMVIGFFSHNVDLESEDYYQREIGYQDEITALNNANGLANKPDVSISETHVVIQFDGDIAFEDILLELKRPNDDTQDKAYVIKDTKTFTIAKTDLHPGKYQIELSYLVKGEPCLQKEEIYI